jgi:predicted nucleotidyltransferase
MQRSGLSYEPVYRVVNGLTKKRIISSKKFGKTLVYSLIFEKEEIKTVFFFYAREKLKEFSKSRRVIFNALSKVNEENIDFLAVFGSYAKGTPTKDSDVDVLCASSDKKEDEREIKSLKYETNLEFAPVVMSKTEFRKIKNENTVFWSDLIKFGIIFKGYELFYSEAYLK